MSVITGFQSIAAESSPHEVIGFDAGDVWIGELAQLLDHTSPGEDCGCSDKWVTPQPTASVADDVLAVAGEQVRAAVQLAQPHGAVAEAGRVGLVARSRTRYKSNTRRRRRRRVRPAPADGARSDTDGVLTVADSYTVRRP